METTTEPRASSFWQRRNWWKIGFFIALFALEVAREVAVLGASAKAEPNVRFDLSHFQDYTSAIGVWHRTDEGGKMAPTVIAIECNQTKATCTMVDAHMDERWVFAPNISNFDAQFSPDNITFDDDSAECATLKFRIDFTLQKVNAIREIKSDHVKNPMCSEMEKRIDLTLGDSLFTNNDALDGHFLPIFDVLKLAFAAR